jgi:hypothetical protein
MNNKLIITQRGLADEKLSSAQRGSHFKAAEIITLYV